MLLIVVMVAMLLQFANDSSFSLVRTGNTQDVLLQGLLSTSLEGRQTYSFDFGRLNPDQGVSFSFSTSFVSDVVVTDSYGGTLYHESRNGGFYERIFPDRTSNISLKITPLCNNCGFDRYGSLGYTFYTRYPYYEIRIVLNVVILASAAIVLLYDFRDSHPVKRLRWLVTLVSPVAALLSVSWYWYAFGYDQWYVGGFFAAVGLILAIMLAFIVPQIMKESKRK